MTRLNADVTAEVERTTTATASAFSLISGYTADKKTFIIELPEDCLYVIGQALHIYRISEPDNFLINLCLKLLAEQTTAVSSDSVQHKVYKEVINSPVSCRTTKDAAYVMYDRGPTP
jgi:hypothetical protein